MKDEKPMLVAVEHFQMPGNQCYSAEDWERGYAIVSSPSGCFINPLPGGTQSNPVGGPGANSSNLDRK